MNEFTPGPWYPDPKGYVWRRPLTDLYEYGGDVAGDKPIAMIFKGWYEQGAECYPVEANAKLMAAAPKLLEAVLDLLEMPDFDGTQITSEIRKNIKHSARTAIAKAIKG